MRPSKGDYVLILNNTGSFRRKILWVGDNHIEWRGGQAKIADLLIFPNRRTNSITLDLRSNEILQLTIK